MDWFSTNVGKRCALGQAEFERKKGHQLQSHQRNKESTEAATHPNTNVVHCRLISVNSQILIMLSTHHTIYEIHVIHES